MGDIKLFRQSTSGLLELPGQTMQIEKSLQTLFETNLDALLGVKFLASEYSTGVAHGGRIDTLGIDEDSSPVIIEFKRAVNENVISQGLFYLNWMMDHKKEVEWLVLKKIGAQAAENVDWSNPRVICIAGDFTKYDQHAVKQMPGNIELLRYRRYGDDLLLLELVHAPSFRTASGASAAKETANPVLPGSPHNDADPYLSQRISYRISQMSGALKDVFDAVYQYLSNIGDDVQVSEKKLYVAFKRIKNFACLEVYPQAKVVTVHLKIDPSTIQLEEGFTRDVSNIGHFGTGDLQVSIRTMQDFERAQSLFNNSYEKS
jgi:predicted transport protein